MSGEEDRAYAGQLAVMQVVMAPIRRAAITALGLPTGTRGLDAGCGIGLQAIELAEAVSPGGEVVGVDLNPALLAEARERVAAAGPSDRVRFEVADVRRLPYVDGEFDWAWSSDCVGYGTPEPVAAVRELARVVRPGGPVALLVWSSQMLVPGYPRLEARLNATAPGLAPFEAGMPPERHHLRGLGLLRAAGLVETQARTFVGEAQAPLTAPAREALAALVEPRRSWPTRTRPTSAACAIPGRRSSSSTTRTTTPGSPRPSSGGGWPRSRHWGAAPCTRSFPAPTGRRPGSGGPSADCPPGHAGPMARICSAA
jgi:SAM-dependent methyltransferase